MSFLSKSFVEIWRELTRKLNKDELEITDVIVRSIWLRRNAFVFKRKIQNPLYLVQRAKEEVLLFQATQEASQPDMNSNAQHEAWMKPASKSFKVNWNAIVDEARGKIGIGVIITFSLDRSLGLVVTLESTLQDLCWLQWLQCKSSLIFVKT